MSGENLLQDEDSADASDAMVVDEQRTTEHMPMGTGTSSKENDERARYCLPSKDEDGFSISDLVWGKVKSHPWWPGQIFDPSDASDLALKHQKNGNFLVAYFADKTFAWCDESQLRPFCLYFSQTEKQSSSDLFLSAVDGALEEVSRRIEVGMTCFCQSQVANSDITCQKVENAGIREGYSGCVVERSSVISNFKPAALLDYVKALAQMTAGGADKLDLVIAKAHLEPFYRSKGYSDLPCFQMGIGGLGESDSSVQNYEDQDIGEDDLGKSDVTPSVSGVRNQNSGGNDVTFIKEYPVMCSKEEKSFSQLSDEATCRKVESIVGVDNEQALIASDNKRRVPDPDSSDSERRKKKRLDSLADPDIRIPLSSFGSSFKVGACISRVASQLTGPPSILKTRGETFQKIVPKDGNVFDVFVSDDFQDGALQTPKLNIGNWEDFSSLDEMLSQIYLAATDPIKGYNFHSTIINFFSEFRNYCVVRSTEKNLPEKVASKRGRKRKVDIQAASSDVLTTVHMKDSYWSDLIPLDKPVDGLRTKGQGTMRGQRKKRKSPQHTCSCNSLVPLLQAELLEAASLNQDIKQLQTLDRSIISVEEKMVAECMPTALVLNFNASKPLPSKTDFIRTFGRYGPLKEVATEVQSKYNCVKVVFKRLADAETAFSSAGKYNIFGPSLLSYRLSNLPSVSDASLDIGAQDKSNAASFDSSNCETSDRGIMSDSSPAETLQVNEQVQRAFQVDEQEKGTCQVDEVQERGVEVDELAKVDFQVDESADIVSQVDEGAASLDSLSVEIAPEMDEVFFYSSNFETSDKGIMSDILPAETMQVHEPSQRVFQIDEPEKGTCQVDDVQEIAVKVDELAKVDFQADESADIVLQVDEGTASLDNVSIEIVPEMDEVFFDSSNRETQDTRIMSDILPAETMQVDEPVQRTFQVDEPEKATCQVDEVEERDVKVDELVKVDFQVDESAEIVMQVDKGVTSLDNISVEIDSEMDEVFFDRTNHETSDKRIMSDILPAETIQVNEPGQRAFQVDEPEKATYQVDEVEERGVKVDELVKVDFQADESADIDLQVDEGAASLDNVSVEIAPEMDEVFFDRSNCETSDKGIMPGCSPAETLQVNEQDQRVFQVDEPEKATYQVDEVEERGVKVDELVKVEFQADESADIVSQVDEGAASLDNVTVERAPEMDEVFFDSSNCETSDKQIMSDILPAETMQVNEPSQIAFQIDEPEKETCPVEEVQERAVKVDELAKADVQANESAEIVTQVDKGAASLDNASVELVLEMDEVFFDNSNHETSDKGIMPDILPAETVKVNEPSQRTFQVDELEKGTCQVDEVQERAVRVDELAKVDFHEDESAEIVTQVDKGAVSLDNVSVEIVPKIDEVFKIKAEEISLIGTAPLDGPVEVDTEPVGTDAQVDVCAKIAMVVYEPVKTDEQVDELVETVAQVDEHIQTAVTVDELVEIDSELVETIAQVDEQVEITIQVDEPVEMPENLDEPVKTASQLDKHVETVAQVDGQVEIDTGPAEIVAQLDGRVETTMLVDEPVETAKLVDESVTTAYQVSEHIEVDIPMGGSYVEVAAHVDAPIKLEAGPVETVAKMSEPVETTMQMDEPVETVEFHNGDISS